MSDSSVSPRTFWGVISLLAGLVAIPVAALFTSLTEHQHLDYHPGTPLYVEQRVQANTESMADALNALRIEIQRLREAMIRQGVDLPEPGGR